MDVVFDMQYGVSSYLNVDKNLVKDIFLALINFDES